MELAGKEKIIFLYKLFRESSPTTRTGCHKAWVPPLSLCPCCSLCLDTVFQGLSPRVGGSSNVSLMNEQKSLHLSGSALPHLYNEEGTLSLRVSV